MMWAFSGGGFSSRAHPLLSWQIAVILHRPTSLARCLLLLRWLSLDGIQSFSPLVWSLLCSTVGFRSKGQDDRIVTFLSALDEEHFREDMLVG
jgi:hypothetical protein